MQTAGVIGIVVRVSDVKGRDKKGDRFISPQEQVQHTTAYCRAAGYDVLVIEPTDLNVSHTTPLDERPAMGEALRQVESTDVTWRSSSCSRFRRSRPCDKLRVMGLRTTLCRHEWGSWRRGLTEGIAEIAGGSDDEIAAERRAFAGVGLPGFGMSAEQDDAYEHRRCSKCRKFETRLRG